MNHKWNMPVMECHPEKQKEGITEISPAGGRLQTRVLSEKSLMQVVTCCLVSLINVT